jgi:hypothetical protein
MRPQSGLTFGAHSVFWRFFIKIMEKFLKKLLKNGNFYDTIEKT